MKNRFTILTAAIALLAFLAVPLGMRGQTTYQQANSISVGDVVVITSSGATTSGSFSKEMTGISTTSTTYGVATDFTTTPEGTYALTIEEGNGNNTYALRNGNLYLSWSSGNSLTTSTEINNASSWTIEFEGSNAIITNVGTTDRKLRYNSSSPRFACYTSAQTAIQLYKQVGASTDPEIQIAAEELALPYTANANGSFNVTYTEGFEAEEVSVGLYYDANCYVLFDGDWISLANVIENPYNIPYMVEANNSTEARTVYMWVQAMNAENFILNAVFAITQAAAPQLFAVNFTLDNDATFLPNEVFTDVIVELEAGTYALPSATKEGFTFDGWNDGATTYAGGANYTVSDDVDFTAQWTENTTPGFEVVDVLNLEFTGRPATTTYGDWSDKTGISGAVYAGNSAGDKNSIQLRTTNNNSGIITTTSAGKVTKVVVTWQGDTNNARVLNVYGKNTPYEAASDLYNTSTQGDLLGTIARNNETTLDITGDYAYIGLRSNSGAMYITEIQITWETSGTPEPSITIAPATLHVDAGQHLVNYLSLAYENIVADSTQCFTVHYCNAQGEEIELVQGETWMIAGVVKPNDIYQVLCTIMANEGDARTAYFKVSAQDAEDNTVYSNLVTVIQDAPVVEMTIAEARAKEVGDEVHTSGIITSISGNGTKTAYMQDATAAIVVYGSFTAAVGDSISVSGTLYNHHGLLEIQNPTVTVLSSGHTIEPTLMTIEQINASPNQGWYIRIENATVTAINGQNTTIAQGGNTIVVRGITGVTYNVNDVISLNGNIGCYDNLQIANPTDVTVTTAGFAYQYSINGVLGNELHGTNITLSNGEAVGGLAFAGWTLNPNNVENILAAGTQYELTADGVVFYAVYSRTVASGSYVRVTETPDDWTGNYLIVNQEYGVAFNGALTTLDSDYNNISVSVNGISISANYETNAGFFTITPTAAGDSVVIQSASGLYIGQNTDANGLLSSTSTEYHNAISFGGDTVNIIGKGGAYLRYNKSSNNKRFRYYKTASYLGQEPIQLFKQEGEITTTTSFYTRVFFNETATANIEIVGPSIIPSGYSLNMDSYTLTNDKGAASFVIEDGGQLIHSVADNNVPVTMQKHINGFTGTQDNYYLIASPFYVDPSQVPGMLDNVYDLYYFACWEDDEEWQNYKVQDFVMWDGQGYLYANSADTDLEFVGDVAPATDNEYEYYSYYLGTGASFDGWALAGNPFACNAYPVLTNGEAADFYKINGNEVALSDEAFMRPLEGIFMKFTDETTSYYFNRTASAPAPALDLTVMNVMRGTSDCDRVRVRFGQGTNLGKFQLNPNHTKVYFEQDRKDYAVVRSANEGEMPVSFKAEENGTYTFSVNIESVEMNYLHLIDNMTGADVDLLVEPSYSFEAKTTDYTSRFKLVFSANNSTDENGNETFAYFNGSEWYISNIGEAILQVVDVTGRIVSSKTVNGNATLTTDNLSAGVYVMRLMNGNDVKTQKVVIR